MNEIPRITAEGVVIL